MGNPALSQGSEAGELVPDTFGRDPGRELIRSNAAVINATRRDAKAGPKAEMRKWLSEPALSRTTDPVLHHALENTDAAGAKISSRQMLAKYASTSPQHAAYLKKFAEGVMSAANAAPAAAGMPTAGPPMGGMSAVGPAMSAMPKACRLISPISIWHLILYS
jgi:hypothetical protein